MISSELDRLAEAQERLQRREDTHLEDMSDVADLAMKKILDKKGEPSAFFELTEDDLARLHEAELLGRFMDQAQRGPKKPLRAVLLVEAPSTEEDRYTIAVGYQYEGRKANPDDDEPQPEFAGLGFRGADDPVQFFSTGQVQPLPKRPALDRGADLLVLARLAASLHIEE